MSVNGPKKKRHTKPCKYFQIGTCPFSSTQCDFLHLPSSAMPSDVHPSAAMCKFHASGHCRNATGCRFRHDTTCHEPTTVDPAWINFASVPEGGYSLGSNNPPMYAPPVSVSPTTYPSSFWTYDSYPQFHPSPTEAPSMHYSEGTSSFITHQLRSSSVDSNSSVSSSLATPTNFPQIDQVQVVGEGQIQISKISLPSRPSAKAQAPGSNIRLKSQSSEKLKAYKTVQCKFFNKPPNFCSRGNQCTFIHINPSIESGESPQEMELKDSGSPKKSISPSLPNKPLTRIDARRQKGFYPVTWRVIGGGVLMGIHKPGLDMVSKAETQDSEGLDYSLMGEQSSEKFYPAASAPGGASNDRSRKRTISNPSPRNAAFAVGIFPAESP